MTWEFAEQIAKIFQSVSAGLAIVVGGIWGYFKFVRFRTLKPRLEFAFDFNHARARGAAGVAVLTLKLRNIGNTKVELREDGRPRCHLSYGLLTADAGSSDRFSLVSLPTRLLSPLGNVFVQHKWIEPSETIDDVKVFFIRDDSARAVQFELEIYGIHRWSAAVAFPLAPGQLESEATSEDEQDDYEAWEAARKGLQNSLVDAERALSWVTQGKKQLEDFIARAHGLLAATASGPSDATTIAEAQRLIDGLIKYSR
jgi:hypothetical protein